MKYIQGKEDDCPVRAVAVRPYRQEWLLDGGIRIRVGGYPGQNRVSLDLIAKRDIWESQRRLGGSALNFAGIDRSITRAHRSCQTCRHTTGATRVPPKPKNPGFPRENLATGAD
jgi:hypothetical protein